MKNVAATSGQSVSFAFLFVEVTARAGNWAGRDKVLNFLSRPPSAILALSQPRFWSEFASCRIRIFVFDARKICKEPKNVSAARAHQEFGTVAHAARHSIACQASPRVRFGWSACSVLAGPPRVSERCKSPEFV
jgi:hypothetical protein